MGLSFLFQTELLQKIAFDLIFKKGQR